MKMTLEQQRAKMTLAQQRAKGKLTSEWQCAYSLGESLATLRALVRMGVADIADGAPGTMFSPRTRILFRMRRNADENVRGNEARMGSEDGMKSIDENLYDDLIRDAGRYNFLRRKFAIVQSTQGGAEFVSTNMPRPTYVAPNAAAELDAAIDAAINGGE